MQDATRYHKRQFLIPSIDVCCRFAVQSGHVNRAGRPFIEVINQKNIFFFLLLFIIPENES